MQMGQSKILVVDDDLAILDAMGTILRNRGYIVDLLPYGEKIFEYIGDFTPDLIILDVMLGAVNGMVLHNLIKSTRSLADTPVIIITANDNVIETLKETFSPDDFIQKPFNIETLMNKVQLKLGGAES
jgi:DNA-binding response OmpR family regulator